jgi:FkbM family methyltransferase
VTAIAESPGRVRLFKTRTGIYYLPVDRPGDAIVHEIANDRIFDEPIVRECSLWVRPGTAVLDVGASFGQMSIILSQIVQADGHVYSFEADQFTYGLLERNIGANVLTNVTAVFGAVYDREGVELFYPEPTFERFASYGSYGIDPRATGGRRVRAFTIDSLELPLPVSLMKVDVQGADLFAMRGARRTIARDRMPIIFEYEEQFQEEFGTSWADYESFIKSIGYRIEKQLMDINYVAVPA